MSGGCYSLIGMHIGDIMLNLTDDGRTSYRMKKLFILFLLFGMDTAQSHLSAEGGVSNTAHIGGFIAGICIAIVVGVNKEEKAWEFYMQIAAFVVGMGFAAFAVMWYSFEYPPRNIGAEAGWCALRMVRNRTIFGDGKDHCVACDGLECIARWEKQYYVAFTSELYCNQKLNGIEIYDR